MNAAHQYNIVKTIYEIHAPSKLPGVPKIMAAFKGREAALISELRTRYNIADMEFENISEMAEDGPAPPAAYDQEAAITSYDSNPMHGTALDSWDENSATESRPQRKSRVKSFVDTIRKSLKERTESFYQRSANVRSMFAVWAGVFFLLVSVGILVTVITVAKKEQAEREARAAKMATGE